MTRTRDAKGSTPATDEPASTTTETTTAAPRRRGRPPGTGPKPKQKSTCIRGSTEAKQKAYVIVEALSGLRSPGDASAVIGVTINRYYQIECRALQGLVDALEPRPAGKQPSPETEAKKLERDRDRLERELRRAHALLRVAQRAVGVVPSQPAREPSPGDGKKRRRRGPRSRTARTLARIRSVTPDAAAAPSAPAPSVAAST